MKSRLPNIGLALFTVIVPVLASTVSTGPVFAQSLKPKNPAPLQAGINKGTVDNFVGSHYWYLTSLAGKTHLHVQFTSLGLFGNPQRTILTVTLSDEKNTWHTPKTLTSTGQVVECDFDGDLKAPTKLLLTVAPPSGGLVRMGGDYQIEATGAVAFGAQSSTDPVVGTYNTMAGYTKLLGAAKFSPDGTIETASGAKGRWKLFDESSKMYVVDIDGEERHSLQFRPGRGLCADDIIIFQALK